MSDLKSLKYTIESCNHCGQCKWLLPGRMNGWDFAAICPIHDYFNFDAYSGQGMLNIAGEIMNGTISHSERLSEMLHTCTACGACDINCKNVRDMEVLDTIYELRKSSAEAGLMPESCRKTAENIAQEHNIYGLPHGDRFAFLPDGFRDDPDADAVLFAGCSVYRHPETVLAAIKILRAGGIKFRLLYEDEWCCGASLWRSGNEPAAEQLVKRNIALFKSLGIKTVITACAECFGAFRSGYPRYAETDFRTVHITQVAAELLKSGKLSFKAGEPMTVTYHDPCMLGRLSEEYEAWNGEIRSYGLHVPEKNWRRGENGVYEPPRELIRAMPGVTLVE
ncbi:MAG: (Fe-S)-binding protein, partial [Oscillospiraceae bacterium]|nr:(Fe-S)-binding protein [Oscillospiraceae bacterium]